MAIGQKQVDYCVEIDELLNVVVVAAKYAVEKKPLQNILVELIPLVVTALAGLSELPLETANRAAFEMTIATKGAELLKALGV